MPASIEENVMLARLRGGGSALVSALTLASCTAAHVAAQPDGASVDAMSSGRFWALMGGLMGLVGVIFAGRALTRSAAASSVERGRREALVALAAGLIGSAVGGLVVARSEGGVGTGHGRGGAIVAIALGTIAVLLAVLALARTRRLTSENRRSP
jgi:hypothetical protein